MASMVGEGEGTGKGKGKIESVGIFVSRCDATHSRESMQYSYGDPID